MLYYSQPGENNKHAIGVASGPSPVGPFTDHGKLIGSDEIGVDISIDQFYIEEDGHKYMFWGSFRGIWAIELADDGLSLKPGAGKRKIAGEDRMLIPDGLLQCDTGVSGKEVIDTVTRVVEEVAEEHGANTAVALAKVKAAVAEKVEDDEELPPWDIVDEVFEDEPVIKESVRAALTEEKVPERVPVERKQVERAAVRNHKIRTDTGIEISFPAEMGSNSEYIEFVNEPNGLISIELKNIGSIENR